MKSIALLTLAVFCLSACDLYAATPSQTEGVEVALV